MKKTKTQEPKAQDYFKPEEIGPLPNNYAGHILIMRPSILKDEFRKREFLVWKATGGFGCDPNKIGRAVFAVCVGDGEHARWDRGNFVASFKGDVNSLKPALDFSI